MKFKQFFRFTRGERRGIYCLCTIAAILFCMKAAVSYHKSEMEKLRSENIRTDSIETAIAANNSSCNPAQNRNNLINGKNALAAFNTQQYCQPSDNYSYELSGKHLKNSTSENHSEDSIKAAIRNWQTEAVISQENQKRQKSKNNSGLMIELNTADTSDLKRLWGIGDVLSQRIIRFRDKLGGFYSTMQLAEVYGLSEETLAKTLPHVSADTTYLKRIDANSASIRELKKHPYVSYYMAVAIDSVRRNSPNGRISCFSRLSAHPDFSKSHKLLIKYLSFE